MNLDVNAVLIFLAISNAIMVYFLGFTLMVLRGIRRDLDFEMNLPPSPRPDAAGMAQHLLPGQRVGEEDSANVV